MRQRVAEQTHEARSPVPFRERVFALAGHSTFREPAGGRSTEAKPIPADHLVAAALSFGRDGPDDVGPDIAFDLAVGRPCHPTRVLGWLVVELSDSARHSARSFRPLRACNAHLGSIAAIAYRALVTGQRCPPAPTGVGTEHWQQSLLYACLLLEHCAEDAFARAARRSRGG